jgi:hypothetical protein
VTLPRTAVSHYRQQQAITVATAREVDGIWSTMSDDLDASWSRIQTPLFETVGAGQLAAAAVGIDYVGAVLDETDVVAPAVATVNANRFVGGTRDGRPLETLLQGAVVKTKEAIGSGQDVRAALTLARGWLQDVAMDSVRDANRQAVSGAITVRPRVGGWVRMLNPPACKFCIMLAGKWFKWNQGFQSHRLCDCRHIPSQESAAGDLTIDPYAYFDRLDEKMQDRLFGKRDAQAIRDGADMYRVINIRSRGLADDALKNTPGRNRGWQSRRWDSPSKMTVDDVYRAAKNRDDAIRLLTKNGFITGEQVAGGNLRDAYYGLAL